jgi:Spy/CpxP family protein refolding chaperone
MQGLSLALALGAAALPGLAHGAPAPGAKPPMADGPGGRDHGRMLAWMAQKLQLTEDQKTKCKTIIDKHKDSLRSRGKAIREARKANREAWEKSDNSPESLKAMTLSLATLKFDQKMEFKTLHKELFAVLTPEQQVKAARMEGRMEGMRMARGGRGMGCGPMGKGMGCGPMGKGMGGGPMGKPGSTPPPPPGAPAE